MLDRPVNWWFANAIHRPSGDQLSPNACRRFVFGIGRRLVPSALIVANRDEFGPSCSVKTTCLPSGEKVGFSRL
jgi:hypothetical protein